MHKDWGQLEVCFFFYFKGFVYYIQLSTVKNLQETDVTLLLQNRIISVLQKCLHLEVHMG